MRNTYIVRQKGDNFYLRYNCTIADEDEDVDLDEELDTDDFTGLRDVDYNGLIGEELLMDDLLVEGDWVYISKGNILHIDDREAQHYGKLKWQAYSEGDEEAFDEYEEKRVEAMKHPKLLTKEEDAEWIKCENRFKRMQEGN